MFCTAIWREGVDVLHGDLAPEAPWRCSARRSGSARLFIELPKAFFVRAWSENGGEVIATKSLQVEAPRPDLVEAEVTTNPPAPIRAPGTTFAVTDTLLNAGPVESGASRTRYYLSLDGVKGAGDALLTGSHSAPGLAAGASHTGTVTVTIPAGTALNTYYLLACADDQSAVVESDEFNNCMAPAGASVTVTRPDLTVNTVSAPPATVSRGSKFPVARAETPRLPGRSLSPALVTATIPTSTQPNTYFLLACADDLGKVVETSETNNCTPSTTPVTITP
jgi:hypothetical protein